MAATSPVLPMPLGRTGAHSGNSFESMASRSRRRVDFTRQSHKLEGAPLGRGLTIRAEFDRQWNEERPAILRLCSWHLNDHHLAEDVTQVVAVHAWSGYRTLRDPQAF